MNSIAARRKPSERGAFILLEVLVSVAILGIAVSAIMRSFNLSLEAARRSEIYNTASLHAQSLLDEIQLSPPKEGSYEGTFGEENPGYSYKLTVDLERSDYKGETRAREVEDFEPLRTYHLEVWYLDHQGRNLRTHQIDGALIGTQRFSYEAMLEYKLFDLY